MTRDPMMVLFTGADLIVDATGPDPIVVQCGDAIHVDMPDEPMEVQFAAVGMPGRDGADGGGSLTGVAGQALSGHRAVRHDAQGLLVAADPNSAAGALVVGVTTGAAASGAAVAVQCSGEISEPSWDWVEGCIFLGTDGQLTQVAPSSGFLVLIGYSAGPNQMIIAPRIIAQLT